jgi:subfamily B ATP-binding cassette protein MsbA
MFFAFFIDPVFAVLVCIGGGMTNLIYTNIYKKTKEESKKYSKQFHQYQGQVIQYIANYKYLKATAFLENYSKKLEKSITIIEASRKRVGVFNAVLLGIREPIVIIVVVVVILIQTQIMQAALGPIIISLLFFYRALTALTNVQNAYNRFLELSGSMENVLEFQNELAENKEKYGATKLDSFNKKIKLTQVGFAYGEEEILKAIDLEVSKDEVIAFVGESGSGKTTLVNIIAGLIPISKGQLSIDGVDSLQIDLRSLQSRIGYITQEPVIFSDTIFNNVTLWDEMNDVNWARFTKALEKAALGNFVTELPEGANTTLGINGVNLSGGQKQRISIARELYKNVDILIMDEATSALDTETEKMIQESMDKLRGQYTILIVAHRLSTIKNADKIVLMSKGNIEAVGNFDKIMKDSPMFNKMVAIQQI